MPKTPEPAAGQCALSDLRAGPLPPIDDAWKDEVVESLMRELRRQLHQIENAKPLTGSDQTPERSANVQTLVRIEKTLTHLFDVHEQRALRQDQNAAARHEEALRKLEQRIDRLIASGGLEDAEAQSSRAEPGGGDSSP